MQHKSIYDWNERFNKCEIQSKQFQMAYGLHPQLYPYLYAPKNPLTHPSTYEPQEPVQTSRHKSQKSKDEASEKEESSSAKDDEDFTIDENENVEID